MSSMIIRTFTRATAVTPSDSIIINCQALYIGGAGDVAVLMEGDTVAVTFKAPPVGTVLNISVQKVMATNTTATLILALS